MADPKWWPLDNPRLTGEWANSPEFYRPQLGHNGLDFGCGTGTPVYSTDDGVIEFEGWGQNHPWMGAIAGISAIVRHAWGYSGYAHLSQTIVSKGQSVARGQLIGHSGNTGGSTGPHLHFETLPPNPNFGNGFAGRVNPRTFINPQPRGSSGGGGGGGALGPKQRKTGPNPVKRRADASTSSAEKQPVLAANTVGDFIAWKRGEQVNDGVANTNVWFQGNSGDWFWSGGFTSQSTANLEDKNPVTPPTPTNTRKVDPGLPARVRSVPNTGGAIVKELAPNTVVTPEGWVTGEKVDNNSIWYKGDGGYSWAGGYTVETSAGLKDLNSVEPKPPVTPPEVIYGPGPVLGKIADWNRSAPDFAVSFTRPEPKGPILDLPASIAQESFTVSRSGYNEGREGVPVHFVLHHTDTESFTSARNTLSGNTGAPTAQYLIKDEKLLQMVDERDTAATNGRWMSNTYGINLEICNGDTRQSPPSAKSHETAAWALARGALRWNFLVPLERNVNVFGHKDVSKSPTGCPGDLDIDLIVRRANEIIKQATNPEVPVDPEVPVIPEIPTELTEAIHNLANAVNDNTELLREIYNR